MGIKRYVITEDFRESIKNSPLTLRQLSKKAGFEVKNIASRNKTISETHIRKLNLLCSLPDLQEAEINYSKNLGKYSATQSSKLLKKSSQLAELIGIILGDGNLCRNRIHISFDKRNKGHIKYVLKLFENISSVKLKYNEIRGTNQSYLYCYNKNISSQLINMGLQRGDKIINRVGVPEWIKRNGDYSKLCIRGLVDTDGCIYFSKRDKQTYVKFTNFNKNLLNDFKQIANKLGYNFVSANKRNVCLYREGEVASFIKHIKPFKSIGDVV